MSRRVVCILLTLCGVALVSGAGLAGGVLRLSQNVPGDSKPIVVHADEIVTWTEGKERILLLKGMVLIEHGVVHARMQRGAGWIDQERTRRTGIMHVELFAEGEVSLENATGSERGEQAFFDLNSRGELKLKAQKDKVVQKPAPDDPFYRKALAEKIALARQDSASAVQQTSHRVPAGAAPESGVRSRESGVQPVQGTPRAGDPLLTPVVPGVALAAPTYPPGITPPPAGPGPGTAPPAAPGTSAVPVYPPGFAPPQPPYAPPGVPGYPPGTVPPAPVPVTPGAPTTPPIPLPVPPAAGPAPAPGANPAPPAPPRQLRIVPRGQSSFQEQSIQLPNGEQAFIVTGGVILTVSQPTSSVGLIDIEADRLVVWTRGNTQQMFRNMRSPRGETAREIEFYLAGNVEIREQTGKESRTLKADEVYYDVGRNVAVAHQADLEFKQAGIPDPIHFRADELLQLSPTKFQAVRAEIFASRLPSDPGLKVFVAESTIEQKKIPKRSIFGRQFVDRGTGQPQTEEQLLFQGRNIFLEVADVPVLYTPYLQGDANDPLGPLQGLNVKYDRIFGTQVNTTWDVYDLIGMDPIPGTRWRYELDYLSRRGSPGTGSTFEYGGNDLFDLPGPYSGRLFAYGIYDIGPDVLGGGRGFLLNHPNLRGRFFLRHYQELPEDFTLQMQASVLSDKNFLEQYYYYEFNRDVNQETYVYLKQQRDNWAWTFLAEPRIRNWVDETQRLPQVDGWLIGQSLFDLFTYNAHASAGYLRLMTTHLPPPPVGPTTFGDNSGRFDLWQDLSLPLTLGPARLDPYVILDLTEYTKDLTGSERGRFYGGGGLRGSVPLSRLYPEVQSDLFNLNGIYHKIVLGSNYYSAHSDTGFTQLPQFDRLQDDATDQAIRDITPIQPIINPANGVFLSTSPLFDPQVYAIRRLIFNRTDTLDTIQVLQADLRQRWQTKRGYPGMQHIVDWFALDLSASYFPQPGTQNFNEPFAFLEYSSIWNVGDRTALVSSGWFDPIAGGARVYDVGAFLNRPDRTNFYIGYRQTDPLQSKLASGSASYIFSPKYAVTASSTYDFGTVQSLSNSLFFTRMGSDLQLSVGVSYNAIVNNFGVVLSVVPNLAARSGRGATFIPGMVSQ